MSIRLLTALSFLALPIYAASPLVLDLWEGAPPGPERELPPEGDTTIATDALVAGRPIVRLGNVATPQIAVYRPPAKLKTGAAVIVCPGGGYHILAYDLEGTEVAAWLNSIGVTGIVLKYRVPLRGLSGPMGALAVQDTRRALELVRQHASVWGIDPQRVGVCGFSAGGHAAAWTAFARPSEKAPVDPSLTDDRPDFALLIYAAGWMDRKTSALHEDLKLTSASPPVFLAAAFDDPLSPIGDSLELARLFQGAGGSAELHIFAKGGHGFGVRESDEPVSGWPALAAAWLGRMGFLRKHQP